MEEIFTNRAPAAIGPYSQAIKAGDFLFVSGAIPIDPETNEVVDGIEAQTKQVMENLKAIIEEAGASFKQVAKFTIFLDRKSTRLNSSHVAISYAVFCL